MSRIILALLLVASPLVPLHAQSSATPEPRTALVIGAAAYTAPEAPLAQPLNDARAIARALQSMGFQVSLRENPDRTALIRSISEHAATLRARKGVGVVYFAGHGVQAFGRSYLVPIGAGLKEESDAPVRAIDVEETVQRLRDTGARINVVVLDACRDSPLKRSTRSSGETPSPLGLASLTPPRGVLVAYSTEPGRVAADGKENNSPYARAILKHLPTPGLPIEGVFKRVREEVERETGGRQVPVEYSMLTGADLVLVPAPAKMASAAPTAPRQEAEPKTAAKAADAGRVQAPSLDTSASVKPVAPALVDERRWTEEEREIQARSAGMTADELPDIRGAARAGDAKAQVVLGNLYLTGRFVTRSNKTAMDWLSKASRQGHPVADNLIGWMHLNGQGGPVDLGKAEAHFRRAADKGLPAARQNLLLVAAQRNPDNPQAILENLRNLIPVPGTPPRR